MSRKNAMVNQTKTIPDGSPEASVAFVDEFKGVNPNPSAGFDQHINSFGPTCYSAIDRKNNGCAIRTALVCCEVLANRAVGDSEHEIQPDAEAEKLLKAVERFAKDRLSTLRKSRSDARIAKAVEAAAAMGIKIDMTTKAEPAKAKAAAGGKK